MKRTRNKISKRQDKPEDNFESLYFSPSIEKETFSTLSKELSDFHENIRLREFFFNVPCQDLARNLLGKVLVRKFDNFTLKARIVETESYLGLTDKASHSYNGKVTKRNKPMFMKPGTTYVYLTYGMYHCFNISSAGDGAAVLLRALEPIEGLDYMHHHRMTKKKRKTDNDSSTVDPINNLKLHELCNGPAKLCISMNIDRHTCNMKDLSEWDGMWLEQDEESHVISKNQLFIETSRIGIDSAGIEWATKPLRYYILGNSSVSRLDKKKEIEVRKALGLQ